jgi:hypothetical protein
MGNHMILLRMQVFGSGIGDDIDDDNCVDDNVSLRSLLGL